MLLSEEGSEGQVCQFFCSGHMRLLGRFMEISAGTATSLVELRSFSGFTSWLTFGSDILHDYALDTESNLCQN
jgi:hypothetical protein